MNTEIYPLFQVIVSDYPIDNTFDIKVDIKGAHKTLGLELIMDVTIGRIKLIFCRPGTPAAKIRKWRSTLKHDFVLKYNGKNIIYSSTGRNDQ